MAHQVTLTFGYITQLVSEAHEHTITREDLDKWELHPAYIARNILDGFYAFAYNEENTVKNKSIAGDPKQQHLLSPGDLEENNATHSHEGGDAPDEKRELSSYDPMGAASHNVTLAQALQNTAGWSFFWACFHMMARSVVIFLQTLLVWYMLRIVGHNHGTEHWPLWGKMLLGLCLPTLALLQSIGTHVSNHYSAQAGTLARGLFVSVLSEKLKCLSPLVLGSRQPKTHKPKHRRHRDRDREKKEAEKKKDEKKGNADILSSGSLVNMISSDTNAFIEITSVFPIGMCTFTEMAGSIIWTGCMVGWSTAVVLGVTIAGFAFQFIGGFRVFHDKVKGSEIADKRLRQLSEFMGGIQIVKYYAWEDNVYKVIGELRAKEAHYVQQANIWKLTSIATTFFFNGLFYISAFGPLITYRPMPPAEDAFVTLTLLATLARCFSRLPRVFACMGLAYASLQRMQEFLHIDVSHNRIHAENSSKTMSGGGGDPAESPAVLYGTFGWDSYTIADVDIVCPPRSLTVVLGAVGCGKSTLLQAALRECGAMAPGTQVALPKGEATRCAYVPQEAWIQETTVRENILFGRPYDEERYRAVLKACSLVGDLQQWGGDLVEVGDRGATLSGGQRQRLSMARACYSDADVYLLDDPISAVDASVGRHLIQKCICGFLSNKIVILATHHPAPAKFATQVVFLGDGRQKSSLNKADRTNSGSPVKMDTMAADMMKKDEEEERQRRAAAASESEVSDAETDKEGEDADFDAKLLSDDGGVSTLPDEQLDEIINSCIGVERKVETSEATTTGHVDSGVYTTYIRGGGSVLCFLIGVVFVLAQVFYSASTWWFAAWTRGAFGLQPEGYVLVLLVFVVLCAFFSLLRTVMYSYFVVSAASHLHNTMFVGLMKSPMHFFEATPLGRITNRFSKDIDYCDDQIPSTLFDFFQLVLRVLGSLVIIAISVYWFAIIIVASLIGFGVLLKFYMPISRDMKRIENNSRSPTVQLYQSTMNGLTTLRAFNRLDDFQARLLSTCDLTSNVLLVSSANQRWIGVRVDWIACLWVVSVSLLVIGMGQKKMISVSYAGLALSQSISLVGYLQFAVRQAADAESYMTSIERLCEYADLPPEENLGELGRDGPFSADGHQPTNRARSGSNRRSSSNASKDLKDKWPANPTINVRDFSVAHYSNPSVNVLQHLNFVIKPGQRVAVVGRTGAGKSSMLSCFFRLVKIPPGNALSINGVSLNDVDLQYLRGNLGIIPQAPTLFHGDIRYNLDPFGEFSDDELNTALEKVDMATYVNHRGGLKAFVGEGGGSMSVGQKQLLCVARALLRRRSILFMDEATANIDEATDAQIQGIVRRETEQNGTTVITIAHRLNTIMDYDLVLVLARGRLIEYGKPVELVERAEAGEEGFPTLEGFTTNAQGPDEVNVFAGMVKAMEAAHHG